MGFQRDEGLSALVRVRGAEETVTGGGHAGQRRCGVKSGVYGGYAGREMGDIKWSLFRVQTAALTTGTVFSQVWIRFVIRHSARHWNGSRDCRSCSIGIRMIWAIEGRGQVISTSTPVWHTGHGRRASVSASVLLLPSSSGRSSSGRSRTRRGASTRTSKPCTRRSSSVTSGRASSTRCGPHATRSTTCGHRSNPTSRSSKRWPAHAEAAQ